MASSRASAKTPAGMKIHFTLLTKADVHFRRHEYACVNIGGRETSRGCFPITTYDEVSPPIPFEELVKNIDPGLRNRTNSESLGYARFKKRVSHAADWEVLQVYEKARLSLSVAFMIASDWKEERLFMPLDLDQKQNINGLWKLDLKTRMEQNVSVANTIRNYVQSAIRQMEYPLIQLLTQEYKYIRIKASSDEEMQSVFDKVCADFPWRDQSLDFKTQQLAPAYGALLAISMDELDDWTTSMYALENSLDKFIRGTKIKEEDEVFDGANAMKPLVEESGEPVQ